MGRRRVLEIAALAGAMALFLAPALYQLDLPGLYYDEAADAVPAMQMLQGRPLELFRGAGLWIGGRSFPLMVMDYVGAVNSYLLVPFFAFLGVGALSMRLMTVLASATGLALTYFLARGLFGRAVAVLAVFLLAVHPSFVFWSRQGIYVTSIMLPLALGGLVCLRRWQVSGRTLLLISGLFLLGLGVSAKLLFLWVVVAAAVLYLALSRKRLSLPQGLGGLASLAVGAAMPLLYNLEGQGTLSLLSRNLVQTEQGVNNTALLPNLATRAGDLAVLLEGGFFWFLGGVFRSPAYPWLALGAAAGLVIMVALPRRVFDRAGDKRGNCAEEGVGDHCQEEGVGGRCREEGVAGHCQEEGVAGHCQEEGVGGRCQEDGVGGHCEEARRSNLGPPPGSRQRATTAARGPLAGLARSFASLRMDMRKSGMTPLSRHPEAMGGALGGGEPKDLAKRGAGWRLPRLRYSPAFNDINAKMSFLMSGSLPLPNEARIDTRAHRSACGRVPNRKGIAFVLGFIILVFVQSGVTVSGLWPTHFFILLPFVAIALAAFIGLLPRALPWPRLAWVVGLAVWAAAFFPSIWVDVQYHGALAETGGWMAHSDGIYRLAEALERRGDSQPLAMDWGIKSSVQLLTQGRVNPQEVFQYQPQPDQSFFDMTYKAMQDTRRIYVFRAGELTVFPRMDAFESLVKRLGKQSFLEETVTQRDGRPLYLIYTAR